MEIFAGIVVIAITGIIFYQIAPQSWVGQLIITAFVVVLNLIKIIYNAFMWLLWGRTHSSNIYGSAGWLDGLEKRKMVGAQNSGLVLGTGQISEEKTTQHLVLLGPTGTGKTVTYLIPNILTLALDNMNCSCVVADPKGEIFQNTSGAMARAGFDVRVLAPRKLTSSIRYNPLDYIKTQANAEEIASMLINIQLKSAKSENFWNLQGKSAVSIPLRLLAFGKNIPLEYRNLYNIRYLLNQWHPESDRMDNLFAWNSDPSLMSDIRGFLSQDLKVAEGAISTAKAAIQPFSDPDLATLTSSSNFDLKQLRQRRTILYVMVEEKDQDYYAFLNTLFYQQFLNMCMENKVEGEPFLPIRLFLEEAGNLQKIPSLRVALAAARSRMVSISLILQSKRQLDLIYGPQESQILIENCLSKLVLPSLDYESTKYIENILGTQTLRYANPHKKDDEPKYSEKSRPLMYADEIRRLPDGKAILIQGNQKPVLLDMEPYFKNPYFSKLAKIPPVEINYNYGAEELKLIDLGNSGKLRKVA